MINLKILYTLTLVFDETLSQCPFLCISDLHFLSFSFDPTIFSNLSCSTTLICFSHALSAQTKTVPSLHLDSLSSFTKIIFTCLHFVLSLLPFAYSMFRNLSWVGEYTKFTMVNCVFTPHPVNSKFTI